MVKCAVRGCQNHSELKPGDCMTRTRPRKRFFSLPEDEGRLRVWLAALRESLQFSTQQQICEDHFLPEHITPTGISPDAIPITPPLEGCWTSPLEHSEDLSDIYEVETEIPPDDDEEEEDDQESEDDEEYDDSDCIEDEPLHIDEDDDREWLPRLQDKRKNSTQKRPAKKVATPRAEVRLGLLTMRFMDLLNEAPEGILDLDEATEKLGTHKSRVYDLTNVLKSIKLIVTKPKNKIQWVGPAPITCFKGEWKSKLKTELLNLKTMEESLDWLIKDCAQQLFGLTDLTENVNSAYVTYEDICQIAAFQDQTVIAIKAPEQTKLEVPTPTEECIKIHLKGSRGPIHVLTCEPNASDPSTRTEQLKNGTFLTLEESRIETAPLLSDIPTISTSAARSA